MSTVCFSACRDVSRETVDPGPNPELQGPGYHGAARKGPKRHHHYQVWIVPHPDPGLGRAEPDPDHQRVGHLRKLHARREAGGFLMSPPCLESQGCQFDPKFLYLLSCSA